MLSDYERWTHTMYRQTQTGTNITRRELERQTDRQTDRQREDSGTDTVVGVYIEHGCVQEFTIAVSSGRQAGVFVGERGVELVPQRATVLRSVMTTQYTRCHTTSPHSAYQLSVSK